MGVVYIFTCCSKISCDLGKDERILVLLNDIFLRPENISVRCVD